MFLYYRIQKIFNSASTIIFMRYYTHLMIDAPLKCRMSKKKKIVLCLGVYTQNVFVQFCWAVVKNLFCMGPVSFSNKILALLLQAYNVHCTYFLPVPYTVLYCILTVYTFIFPTPLFPPFRNVPISKRPHYETPPFLNVHHYETPPLRNVIHTETSTVTIPCHDIVDNCFFFSFYEST